MTGAGRYAPSPSGDLHLGNLRTALLAWLFARSTSRAFVLRIEDLDRVRQGAEERQIADLRAIGLDWDDPIVRQSERLDRYARAVASLQERGLTYECFCTRREIADAASAPHAPPGAYPGTCHELSEADRERLRLQRASALRLRADMSEFAVQDVFVGRYVGVVDDFVLVRGDGTPAYNLAVVVDDGEQGIDQVVRGDDLLSSAPRQAYLAGLLGIAAPTYVHVPLALNDRGERLAKRDGAVTLDDLQSQGVSTGAAYALITQSLGLPALPPSDLVAVFDPAALPRTPWTFHPPRP
ncbi:MAG: putative aminoacyl-tRNA synthetase [Nocardioidaceae bacterium]|nr:putative aminoacyl-tRNA synthetase [Nocardioidaceae bacterium]